MSDHGSYYSSDSNPFNHSAYGDTVISAGVGMGMLRSGFPAGGEPVPRVSRSLYDKNHCGGCDAQTDYSENWKEQHIHDNIACRIAYLEKTYRYEREAFATMPDPVNAPEGSVPLQYSNPPVTQSETQSAQAYLIRHSPQYPQQQFSDQVLSPNAYQTNYPSTWLDSSHQDQGYAQYPTEMHDNSYTGDASHNSSPAHGLEAQRAAETTVSASQERGYTSNTHHSGSSRHGYRRAGGSRRG
ncbi:hypothetical protein BOTCAL_0160g00030 [Botryotinia calthae]|uniref:Uncharacterized protein n=1 Tax=Botryotinia calthae TaxID=38488 RepID=A0A4Y8D451_9HELO|nr:hypothetical protein BOTCAL_0160g00030 [Botryotinia calthae]